MSRQAILIGSGKFGSASLLRNLQGPAADVAAFSNLLQRSDRGSFSALTLVNRRVESVEEKLFSELKNASREDTLLVYFSGHGLLDSRGRLCLSGRNSAKNNIEATTLRSDIILEQLANSKPRHKALILDCCYAATLGENLVPKDADQQIHSILASAARRYGTYILASSGETQISLDGPFSNFIRSILEAIETGYADDRALGRITLSDLLRYCRMKLDGGPQEPQGYDIGGIGDDFVISESGKASRAPENRITGPGHVLPTHSPDQGADAGSDHLSSELGWAGSFERLSVDIRRAVALHWGGFFGVFIPLISIYGLTGSDVDLEERLSKYGQIVVSLVVLLFGIFGIFRRVRSIGTRWLITTRILTLALLLNLVEYLFLLKSVVAWW